MAAPYSLASVKWALSPKPPAERWGLFLNAVGSTSASWLLKTNSGKGVQESRDGSFRPRRRLHSGSRRGMPSRTEIYRTKAEECRRGAMLSEDAEQRNRLLALADQWARMGEREAKQPPSRTAARWQDRRTGERMAVSGSITLGSLHHVRHEPIAQRGRGAEALYRCALFRPRCWKWRHSEACEKASQGTALMKCPPVNEQRVDLAVLDAQSMQSDSAAQLAAFGDGARQ